VLVEWFAEETGSHRRRTSVNTQYRKIQRRMIREAKRRKNDRYIANAKNKTRAMWRIITKELRSNP
jgi:hypothetical protein